MTISKQVMARQRSNAKARGIEWKLSYEEWGSLWSGKSHLRGRGSNDLCMCRHGDVGAYEIGNVYIGTGLDNRREAIERRHIEFIKSIDIDSFKEDYLVKGFIYKELADKYNISQGSVSNLLDALKLPKKGRGTGSSGLQSITLEST